MFLLCIQWIKKCGEAHEGLIADFFIVYHTFRFFSGEDGSLDLFFYKNVEVK